MRAIRYDLRGMGRSSERHSSRSSTSTGHRRRFSVGVATAVVLLGALSALNPAHAALSGTGVGPTDPSTNFPAYYTDTNGMAVQLCLTDPQCLPLGGPLTAPDGEAFYYAADATVGPFKYRAAVEAAYAGAGTGQEVTFMRSGISAQKGGLVAGGTYTVTDPFTNPSNPSEWQCTADSTGVIPANACRLQTSAAPVPRDFATATTGRIGPFLTWDTFGAAAGAPAAGFIGDYPVPHKVTGSPTGWNKLRVTGPGLNTSCTNADGSTVTNCTETDLFQVSGKIQPGTSAAISASSWDFGNVPVAAPATKAFTYTNTSSDGTILGVTGVSLSAASSTDYSLGGDCSTVGTLSPGTTCTVTVTYSPTGASPDAGTVTISSDNATVGNRMISLSGKSVGVPFVDTPAPPAALAFGTQATGSSSPEEVVIIGNKGVANVGLVSAKLPASTPSHYKLGATNTCATLAPNATCEVGIVFAPVTNGVKNVNLTLTFDDGTVATVPLTGTGVVAATPGAPTIGSTSVGQGSATVNWTPPTVTGSSAVSGYAVKAFSGTTQVGATQNLGSAARSATFVGLAASTTYSLRVQAVNGSGPGATASVDVTTPAPPPTLPSAPTNVSATRGNASATVAWGPPLSGGTVTGYDVKVSTAAGVQVGALRTAVATARSTVVTGLTNGTAYSIQVRARSAAGAGTYSSAVSVIPATSPGAPTIGTAVAGVAGGTITATANWTAPTSTGGSAITGYRVRALRMSSTGTVLSTTVSAVQPGTTRTLGMALPATGNYRFTVQAINAVGAGAQSLRSNLVAGR